MPDEYYDIEKFIEAMELGVIESKLEYMNCLLCQTPTLNRSTFMEPFKPAQPILGAVCDVCQCQPDWEEEASLVVSVWIVRQQGGSFEDTI